MQKRVSKLSIFFIGVLLLCFMPFLSRTAYAAKVVTINVNNTIHGNRFEDMTATVEDAYQSQYSVSLRNLQYKNASGTIFYLKGKTAYTVEAVVTAKGNVKFSTASDIKLVFKLLDQNITVESSETPSFNQTTYIQKFEFTAKDKEITLTYESNYPDGAGNATKVEKFNGSSNHKLLSYSKCAFIQPDYYTFKGWSTEQSGLTATQIRAEGYTAIFNNDHTYYAIWKPIPVEVTLDANDGSGRTKKLETTAQKAYAAPANAFTPKDGKSFLGWATSKTGKASSALELTGASSKVTLYAIWANNVTVSFNANGGSGTQAAASVAQGTYTLPASSFTAPAGKQFAGWATTAAGKAITTKTIEVKANTTLYAVWTQKPISAGYKLSDPTTGASYKVTSTTDKTVEYTKPNVSKANVTIPSSVSVNGTAYQVTSIAAGAFKNNTKLKTLTVGKNVTVIRKNAFYGCKKLKKVTLNKNLETIGTGAFSGCAALTKITIPANVESIGKQAFNGCKKLKAITIKTEELDASSVGKNAFKGIAPKAKFKVPSDSLKDYRLFLRKKGVPKTALIK